MSEKKTFGLIIKSKDTQQKTLPIPSIFGDNDDEIEISKEKDASKKFQMLYGSNKSKDQRIIDEVLQDDPNAYEYDEVYDDMEKQRNFKTAEQKEADKERKPKYAHQIIHSASRRQYELLMVKDRQQQMERSKEGDEFKDKETFVTGAYKKQIEEREKIRKELEEQERIDGRLKVEDQAFWQANFNRGILDKLSRPTASETKRNEPAAAIVDVEKKSINSEDEEKSEQSKSTKQFEELKPGLNLPSKSKKEKETEKEERRRHRHDSDRDRRRRHDSGGRRLSRKRDRSPEKSHSHGKKENDKPKDEKMIQKERMKKIREILKQRNDESAVFMAKQRYLQRKANGEIVPPMPT